MFVNWKALFQLYRVLGEVKTGILQKFGLFTKEMIEQHWDQTKRFTWDEGIGQNRTSLYPMMF